jgi:hypothetical protein
MTIQEKIKKIEEYIQERAYWCESGRAYSRRAEPALHAIMFENRLLTLCSHKELKEYLALLKARIRENELNYKFRYFGLLFFGRPLTIYAKMNKTISASLDRMIETLQIC